MIRLLTMPSCNMSRKPMCWVPSLVKLCFVFQRRSVQLDFVAVVLPSLVGAKREEWGEGRCVEHRPWRVKIFVFQWRFDQGKRRSEGEMDQGEDQSWVSSSMTKQVKYLFVFQSPEVRAIGLCDSGWIGFPFSVLPSNFAFLFDFFFCVQLDLLVPYSIFYFLDLLSIVVHFFSSHVELYAYCGLCCFQVISSISIVLFCFFCVHCSIIFSTRATFLSSLII